MKEQLLTALRRLELWFWGKFFILLIALGSGLRRRRMSHNNGVAGRGTIRIVDDQQFPPTEFFEPGRVFPCRIRHACIAYLDDAMHVARSATLKFADSEFVSPFDLQMNSGRHAFFWNARSFLQFAFWRHESGGIEYEKYYHTYHQGRRAASWAFRRNPSSWSQVFFHSQTPFLWKAKDGKRRYVKFRLIPENRGPESAAPTETFVNMVEGDPNLAGFIANQRVLPGETHGVNYLKNEWTKRIKERGAIYHLQLQLHEVQPDDSPEVLNPHLYWPEDKYPWMDLATVHITEALTYEQQCRLAFEITNLPPSMAILPAKNIDEYTSLNYMRKQSIWAIRSRLFFQRLIGYPKYYPDDHEHNINPPGM
jgi:arachidonate 5-lipoxygenase